MSAETYRSAGVDSNALGHIKERIAGFARLTHGSQVLGGTGGFAGMYHLQDYTNPVLVSSTDGVGTKLKVASLLGHYESLGIDLVNLNVDDVLTRGAKPLFFLDYLSMGEPDIQRTDALLRGMAWACREADCALIGGETAQMPGVYTDDTFDLAGFVVGVVEHQHRLDGSTIGVGDALLALASSGVHTNGFSLIRKVFKIDENPAVLHQNHPELGHSLGEELLVPHRCYYPALDPILRKIKGMAHITGGGIVENIPRALPDGLAAHLNSQAWPVHPIFSIIQRHGSLDPEEMYRVFNMGLGMVMVCEQSQVDDIQTELPGTMLVGEVVLQSGEDRVILDSRPV